jgi:hypothetical protein
MSMRSLLFALPVIGLLASLACDGGSPAPAGDAATGSDAEVRNDGAVPPADGSTPPPPPSCDRVTCGGHGSCSVGPMGAMCACESGYHPVGATCVSDTTDLDALEALVAGMATGQWLEITGSRIEDVLITSSELDAIDSRIHAVSGPRSAIIIWCSSAFDGRRWYFGVCGGHNAYNGNELYTFDLATLSWSRLYDPAPLGDEPVAGLDYAPVWGPQAVHHYDGIIYSPRANAIFVMWPTPHAWRYSLDEADPAVAWQAFDSPAEAMGDVSVWDQPYYKTALHPDTGEILIYGGSNTVSGVAALDPETLTYSRSGGRWDLVISGQSTGDVDPVRRRMFSINRFEAGTGADSGVLSIDIDADPLSSGATTLGGEPPAGVSTDGCFLHHAPSGLMWWWGGERETFSFDPDAASWTPYTNAAGPAPSLGDNSTGVYQKCIYVPELDVFAGYNNASEGVWLYRMP